MRKRGGKNGNASLYARWSCQSDRGRWRSRWYQREQFGGPESDDGDVEEADYISSTGEPELVTRTFLQSCAMCEKDADEPALYNSLLLLDEDLCESDETEPDEECNDMEVEPNEASGNSYSEDDDHSSLSSHSSGKELLPCSPSAAQGGGTSRRGRGRGRRGGQEEGEEDEGGEEEGEEGLAEAP